jgi:hypothetical protein
LPFFGHQSPGVSNAGNQDQKAGFYGKWMLKQQHIHLQTPWVVVEGQ